MDNKTIQSLMKSETAFAAMSAFRPDYSYEENVKRNKELAATLKRYGYSVYPTKGYWKGEAEESFFIVSNEDEKKFMKNIIALGKKYDQDGVLIKSSNGVRVYDKTGKVTDTFRKFSPGKKGDFYTELKNGETFVFESEEGLAKKILDM